MLLGITKLALAFALTGGAAAATERPGVTYKIFQFPPNMIPRIDGNPEDWSIVPEDYVIGSDQLSDDDKHRERDRNNLDVRVRVGWVKGLNRLYFLYEAYDNYWDFARPDLHNDTFEVVVDGDLSGGPLIERMRNNANVVDEWDAHFSMHGVHAQNYHIFTPAEGKDWTLVWGCAQWLKELPYANAAYSYNFRPGQPGRLVLEFWITPFDYAGCEGPQRAVESILREDKLIGLSWAVLDYDDVNQNKHAFWNLSPKHTMYGNASELLAFRLMPLDPKFAPRIDARWSFQVVDMSRRLVAFQDQSVGRITSWKWDFGDGATSTDQHPMHAYAKAGEYVVVLNVEGPDGNSRRSKVWDVAVK